MFVDGNPSCLEVTALCIVADYGWYRMWIGTSTNAAPA